MPKGGKRMFDPLASSRWEVLSVRLRPVGWIGVGLMAVVCILFAFLWYQGRELAVGLLGTPLALGFWLAITLIVVGLPKRR